MTREEPATALKDHVKGAAGPIGRLKHPEKQRRQRDHRPRHRGFDRRR